MTNYQIKQVFPKFATLNEIYEFVDKHWLVTDTVRSFFARTCWSKEEIGLITPQIIEPLEKSETRYKYYLQHSSSDFRKSMTKSVFRLINASQQGIYMTENGVGNIELTRQCNCACKHCYYDAKSRDRFMEDSVLEKALSYFMQYYGGVNLIGGEPLLDNRVLSIARKNPHMLFYFTTNGTVSCGGLVHEMAALGNIFPIISLEGWGPIHDRIREDGSFAKALQTIKTFREQGIPVFVISTITHLNYENLLGNEFLANLANNEILILHLVKYYPVGEEPDAELVLDREQLSNLDKRVNEIKRKYPFTIDYETKEQKICGGFLSFDVDGNIKACPVMHFSKYKVNSTTGDEELLEAVRQIVGDWQKFTKEIAGGCPMYSNPSGLIEFFKKNQWLETHGSQRYAVDKDFLTTFEKTLDNKDEE